MKRIRYNHHVSKEVDYAGVTVFRATLSYKGGGTWTIGDSRKAAMKRLAFLAKDWPVCAKFNERTNTFWGPVR